MSFSKLLASVEDRLAEIAATTGTSDFQVAISMCGHREHFAGPRRCRQGDDDSLAKFAFEISCVVKPLIAAVALTLAERGQLNLDAPVAQYLPELQDADFGRQVTVRHLISHTAGHRGFLYFPPIARSGQAREAALSRLRGADQLFWPGSTFNHENSTPALLGLILACISGSTARELIWDEVLRPLGVAAPASEANGHGEVSPKMMFPLSILDFLTVVEALMSTRFGEMAHRNPLHERTILALREHSATIPRVPNSAAETFLPVSYCLGLAGYRNGFLGYEGISRTQAVGFRFLPDLGIAAVVGVNQPNRTVRRAVLRAIVDSIIEDFGLPNRTTYRPDLPNIDVQLSDIAGHYTGVHAWDLELCPVGENVILAVRDKSRLLFQKRGRFDPNYGLVLEDVEAGFYEPALFRYSRTDELCLMFGMYALKQVPLIRM